MDRAITMAAAASFLRAGC